MDRQARIIGIDPGTRFTGVGVIDKTGDSLKLVFSQTIATEKIDELDEKLLVIYSSLLEIIERFQPKVASVEKIFHSVNPHSSLILGHARGVVLLAARKSNLEIFQYAPNEVKSAVTGAGKASKEQVSAMVRVLLNLDRTKPMKDDESDALAIAICHANTNVYSMRSTKIVK